MSVMHSAAVSGRAQTLGEEIANSVSHGVALLGALAATPFLVVASVAHGAPAIVGASVFAASVVVLYTASTLYHALSDGAVKRVFRVLDHAAIFVLIAGTYTPFTLGVLRGGWGWTLFGVVWGLATAGIVLAACGGTRHPILAMGLYLGMGWLVVVAARPLWLRMSAAGLAWLVAGGVAYTLGTAFWAAGRLRYGHFVFHLLVVAGTACHFVAVWGYAT